MNKIILKLLQALWRLLSRSGGCCADIIVVCFALSIAGCGTRPTVLDGSATTLGVIVPDQSTYYGFQIFSRVNGLEMNAPTGTSFSVERYTVSSNRYFGVIAIDERTRTKIEAKK